MKNIQAEIFFILIQNISSITCVVRIVQLVAEKLFLSVKSHKVALYLETLNFKAYSGVWEVDNFWKILKL